MTYREKNLTATVPPKKAVPLRRELAQQRTHDAWLAFFFGQEPPKTKKETFQLLREAVQHLRSEMELREPDKRKLLESVPLTNLLSEKLVALSENEIAMREVSTWTQHYSEPLPKQIGERRIREFLRLPSSEAGENTRGIPIVVAVLLVKFLIERFLPTTGRSSDPVQQANQLADAAMEFFGSTDATRRSLPLQLEGDYLLYRRSAHWPGHYVKGHLRVKGHPLLDASGTPRVPAEYALYSEELHVHDGEDGSAPARELYVGVLSRKSSYIFILSSLSGPTGTERGAPRFTLIHSTVFEEDLKGKVSSMTGITVSPFGLRHAWASTVCIERCAGEPALKSLGLFSQDDKDGAGKLRIPPSVIARLQQHGASSTDI